MGCGASTSRPGADQILQPQEPRELVENENTSNTAPREMGLEESGSVSAVLVAPPAKGEAELILEEEPMTAAANREPSVSHITPLSGELRTIGTESPKAAPGTPPAIGLDSSMTRTASPHASPKATPQASPVASPVASPMGSPAGAPPIPEPIVIPGSPSSVGAPSATAALSSADLMPSGPASLMTRDSPITGSPAALPVHHSPVASKAPRGHLLECALLFVADQY
ncbi:hypothetical protein KIPB_002246, partial [Kipferlia bialata]|eukprot:g2246.t1